MKQQLAGDFSSGTEVALSPAVRIESSVNSAPADHTAGQAAAKDAEETVMRKFNAERGRSTRATLAARARSGQGMSLVEATIILMVLAILTAVIAPSMGDYVNDARAVKAKEDVEAIGQAIARHQRDTGAPFLLADPQLALSSRLLKANRVDMLVGPGLIPAIDTTTYTDFNGSPDTATSALNWDDAIDNDVVDDIGDHLVANNPGTAGNPYPGPTLPPPAGSGGPRFGIGWRGAYLSALSTDPWGYRYAVNSVFLGVAQDSTVADKGWNYDVMVLSAGANNTIDTRFSMTAADPGVDDVAYVIQGSTR